MREIKFHTPSDWLLSFITDNQQQLLRKKHSQSQLSQEQCVFYVRTVFQCILFTALELKAVWGCMKGTEMATQRGSGGWTSVF